MPVALIKTIKDRESIYKAIVVWCPGCERIDSDGIPRGGLHLLPISGDSGQRPTWVWNQNLEKVTLEPSILTRGSTSVCHSFLRDGVWEFLNDSTHKLAGQKIPMVELPDWVGGRVDDFAQELAE